MAESPSSALPGGVEWLPALGGAHLLRAEVRGEPPALVLHTAEGEEHRIDPGPIARFDGTADYLVPAGLSWSGATLVWPDGTRAVLPTQADVITLPRRAAPEATPPALEPLPWTAPPWPGNSTTLAAALAAARAELEAAREAGGTAAALAAELSTARTELAVVREEADAARRTGADARAHLAGARRDAALALAEVATLRADLEAERAARARAEAALRDGGGGSAFLERVAELDRDVEGLRTQVRLERRAREQAEAAAAAARRPPEQTGRLVADLDAAAAALRAAVEPTDGASPSAALPELPPAAAGSPAAPSLPPSAWPAAAASPAAAPTAASPRPLTDESPLPGAAWPGVAPSLSRAVVASSPTMYRAVAAPARGAALVPAARERCLRHALVALAQEDPLAAGSLLAGLLPAQGAVLDETITYDLTVRGTGTFAIFVADGSARVQRISRSRPRAEAAFHLNAEPLVLAELLAGQERKLRRFGRAARYSGRRRRLRAIAPLPAAPLSLAAAVRAGARLEPSLVYRALPFAIPPEWTRGHVFTVAQEIVELAPRAWYVTARDGVPLRVLEHSAGAAADATVTMTRAAFDRLLRDEPMAEGERPVVRGDRAAVAALKRWTDLARGV